MMLFYLLPYYKSLWSQREQDKQYWNKIAIEFLKRKHNADITRKEFPIEIYIGELLHKSYFITLTLQEKIIIELTKKLVVLHVVGNLVLLD